MNRFATFADPDEAQTVAAKPTQKAVNKDEPKKKVVIKAKEDEGFEMQGRPATASRGDRGGRGGRGGRGRGDRPEGESRRGGRDGGERGDRRGGRGGRGGRGRGDRPPREDRAAAEVGADGEVVEKTEHREKRFHKYEGKAREENHPFDRKDGTGRGRRGDKKGGAGRGNWGNDRKPADGEVAEGEEKPTEQVEEVKAEKVEKVEEEPIIYEEVGVSLDDYLAQKQANSKGLLAQASGRKHEKATLKGVEQGADVKRIMGRNNQLSAADVYAPKVEGGDLFSFSAKEEEVYEERGAGRGRGDRGGRGRGADRGGRRDGADRKPREQGRGNRKGGKIVVDDNDFPTL